MRLGPIVAVSLAAALAAGCGKSSTTATSGGAPQAAPAPALNPEEAAKRLAALPEPYKTADLANGEAKFGLCKSCHTLEAGGANMTGPNLHGIMGTKSAAVPGFKFSDAMQAANLTWDTATLDRYLTKPADVVPGTKMTFPGLSEPKDRTDVIAYLMINSGS